MSKGTENTTSPWTDEHWRAVCDVILNMRFASRAGVSDATNAVLDALAPRVAELQRAAKVEALREAAGEFVVRDPGTATNLYRCADEIVRGER